MAIDLIKFILLRLLWIEIYDKVVALLSKNQKLAAEKLLYDTKKYGLKEAKDMIDEIEKKLYEK